MKTTYESIQQAVSFRTEEEWFGLPVLQVNEIILPHLIQPITTEETKTGPSPVVGVIHLRGLVIPILSFRRLLQKDDRPIDKKTRIIIVSDASVTIGLLVDEVSQVLSLSDRKWDVPPTGITSYVMAVSKHKNPPDLLYMLDVSKLLLQEGSGDS